MLTHPCLNKVQPSTWQKQQLQCQCTTMPMMAMRVGRNHKGDESWGSKCKCFLSPRCIFFLTILNDINNIQTSHSKPHDNRSSSTSTSALGFNLTDQKLRTVTGPGKTDCGLSCTGSQIVQSLVLGLAEFLRTGFYKCIILYYVF